MSKLMNSGCAVICTILLYISIVLMALIAQLGFWIYNGIYWGKIRHVFPLVDVSGSNLPRLEKVALAAWALCFLPIVGPLVPVCLIIVWTMPNRCDVEKQNFIGQARVNGSKLQEYWMNVIEKSETTWDDWEDSEFFKGWFHSRCGRANIMNWAFLAVFMYVVFVFIVLKISSKCGGRQSRKGYAQY